MPLFPETFEDLELIYTKLNPCKSECEEELLDELRSAIEALGALERELGCGGRAAGERARDAAGHCCELAELSAELGRRAKYDPHLAVFRDEFAWYSSCAAALSAELEEYGVELALYGDAAGRCRDELEALVRLVEEYGADPHEECDHAAHEYCDKYGEEWEDQDECECEDWDDD